MVCQHIAGAIKYKDTPYQSRSVRAAPQRLYTFYDAPGKTCFVVILTLCCECVQINTQHYSPAHNPLPMSTSVQTRPMHPRTQQCRSTHTDAQNTNLSIIHDQCAKQYTYQYTYQYTQHQHTHTSTHQYTSLHNSV